MPTVLRVAVKSLFRLPGHPGCWPLRQRNEASGDLSAAVWVFIGNQWMKIFPSKVFFGFGDLSPAGEQSLAA